MARGLPTLGLIVTLAAVGAQTAVIPSGGGTWPNAAVEGGLLDWLSIAALMLLALVAALRALAVAESRLGFALLALMLAFLATDDAIGLHERIGAAAAASLSIGFRGDALFLVPYLPLLAGAFGLLWMAARETDGAARRAMHAGLALLAVSLAARAVAGATSAASIALEEWERAAGVTLMNDAELAAWLLLSAGLGASLCAKLAAPARAADRLLLPANR